MRAVFLSYRRDDTQTVTGFIYSHLTAPAGFGPDGVFMDIDDIPPGIDFREVIDETVSRCRFFLAVIGPRWVTPRLQQPGDFVRLEIEAALRRGIPLVPVLVDGAAMPTPDDLPESLRPLVYLNATSLRPGRQFAADIAQLVKGLHKAEEWKQRKAGTTAPPPLVPPVPPTSVRTPGERLALELPGGVTMAFAWCPPGTFLMGSPISEAGRSDDEEQHRVRLTRGFYCGVHPVTQEEWKAVMNTEPSRFQGARLPVEGVSWDDATAFCAAVRRASGKAVRLPTEAEWEYACRGGMTAPFYWGGELNGTQANCDGGYPHGTRKKGPFVKATTPVGHYATTFPHPWGLADVHGNVYEWCADWYDGFFYTRSPADDPECRDGERTKRVSRGGAWGTVAAYCRAANRYMNSPTERASTSGFRVVFHAD